MAKSIFFDTSEKFSLRSNFNTNSSSYVKWKKLLVFLTFLVSFKQNQRMLHPLPSEDARSRRQSRDWFAKDAGVKIIPPATGTFESVIFTFMDEGWAQGE